MSRALAGAAVASVEVVATFQASAAQVARLRIGFEDGRPPLTAIAKSATGPGLAAARRERRFFERVAPLWEHPAPAFLGASEEGRGEEARLLLLAEDLGVLGYAPPAAGVTPDQLRAAADTLVSLHARFWEDLQDEALELAHPAPSVTQSAQAWPAAAVEVHAAAARRGAARFLEARGAELTPRDRALLEEVVAGWEQRFLARVAAGRAVTLIHGDFHLLGNVFFATGRPPRVVDWSELKPGLGPHDLAYCLLAAPSEDRPVRDLALLRRYWEGLRAAGVGGYGWELCQWDFRFSLLTNLFQSVFQDSLGWFRRTADVIEALDCLSALRVAAPGI